MKVSKSTHENDINKGPLGGIRIVDLTSVIMGPYATQILGDYGADVIKVEPPVGDVMRQAGPMRNEKMGHFYLTTNRNKRSVVIDLKTGAGRQVLLDLLRTADVLVYNIRPKAMRRLGLSYEEVRTVAPHILYVGAFGFSQRGPYADRPAYDDLIQGVSGIPWLMQRGGAPRPAYAPLVLVDRIAGLQLVSAITTALLARERGGGGQRVDVPMFEGMAAITLGEHMAGQLFDPPTGAVGYLRSLARDRRPYATQDGYICVMVYNDKQWRTFLSLIGEPDKFANDARFGSQSARLKHIDEVYGYLSDVLQTRSSQEWLMLFAQHDIPAVPMNTIADLLHDEHLNATGFLRWIDHPSEGRIRDTAVPVEWSGTPPESFRAAPRLGEHTHEVLEEIGYSQTDINRLADAGVIAFP